MNLNTDLEMYSAEYIERSIEEYSEYPHLSKDEILENFETIWSFLKRIHHGVDDHWNLEYGLKCHGIDLAIEVRPLRSDKGLGGRYYRPHYIYRFNDLEKKRFWEYYYKLCKVTKKRATQEEYVIPHCLYHGVYNIDTNIAPISQKGVVAKTKLASNSAHYTTFVVVDIDGINISKYLEYKKIFIEKGLESNDLFTGHGVQMSFVLDKPSTDLYLLEKFFHLCKDVIGIEEADAKVIDPGRIVRAGGFNSKGALEGDKFFGKNIIKTKVLASTDRRYSLTFIFEKFGVEYVENRRKLNEKRYQQGSWENPADYPYWDEHVGHIQRETAQILKYGYTEKKSEIDVVSLSLDELYPALDVGKLPEGCRSMLYGFREGFADNALFFLTIKLRELNYSEETVVDAMLTLATLDTHGYAWEESGYIEEKVSKIYNSNYMNARKDDYMALQREFGALEMEYSDILEIRAATTLNFDRRLFIDQIIKEDDTDIVIQAKIAHIEPFAFILWLTMLMESSAYYEEFGKHLAFTREDLVMLSGKSKNTVLSALNCLCSTKVGLVDKVAGVTKLKQKDTYYINHHANKKLITELTEDDLSKGFFSLEKSFIKNLIISSKLRKTERDYLSQRAAMVLMYIKFRVGEKKSVKVSQDRIAQIFNVERSTITKAITELHTKKILVRIKNQDDTSNKYVLLT